MAFSFSNNRRRILPQVIDALQRLEEDPEELDHERIQRYNEPPPPYPSSGETTQPASPEEPPVVDEPVSWHRWWEDRLQSAPNNQFDNQVARERERIIYQIEKERKGRRQTLPYDKTLDFRANSENNVRARWVEQGVWKEEWGPAWPKGAKPSDNTWLFSRKNPGGPHPTGRWRHETEPEPTPAPEPEPEPIPNIFAGWKYTSTGWKREEPKTTTEEQVAADVAEKSAATSERDTSASRPYHQFLFQVSKEREWIGDELQYQRLTGILDIDAKAHERVKNIWIKDKIWNPKWDQLPGMTWLHEELDEKRPKTPDDVKAFRRIFGPPPDAVGNGAVRSGETSSSTRQNGTPLEPRNGDANWSPANEQGSPERPTHTGRWSSLGLAESGTSNRKSNPQGQQQANVRIKRAPFEQPLAGTVNGPGRPNRSQAGFQPPIASSVSRRSARIAELQKQRGVSERSSMAGVVTKRKRGAAAPPAQEANEPSRSKRRKIVSTADSHGIRKEQSGANTRTRTGRRSRSS